MYNYFNELCLVATPDFRRERKVVTFPFLALLTALCGGEGSRDALACGRRTMVRLGFSSGLTRGTRAPWRNYDTANVSLQISRLCSLGRPMWGKEPCSMCLSLAAPSIAGN